MDEEMKKKLAQIPPEMLEEMEDEYVSELAAERLEHADLGHCFSREEVCKEFGITEEDIANVGDVEIE